MTRRLLIAACMMAHGAGAQSSVWQRLEWGSVEILTTGGGEQACAATGELAAVWSAVRRTAPELARGEGRLRVVLFARESEGAGFRLSAFSPAYYAPGPGWSAIVVFGLHEGNLPALRHEFIHHLLRAAGRRLPLWLEEGLADALSGLPEAEAERRVRMLRCGRRVAWRELFGAKPGSELYRNWESARLYYAQSWAIVEALMLGSGGRVGPEELEKWSAASQLPEESVEALLRRFLRRPRAAARKWKADAKPAPAEVHPAPAGLVWTVLGRLSMQLGDLEAAEESLRKAALLWPEALLSLGELQSRQGRLAEARQTWQQAMAHGVADAATLLRLAVLKQDLPEGDMIPVLERLLEADP
ncbi:MAG: hypothetical protein NZR01_00440 [Bryobacteraceae bacterium]|nr:hypothetical protein [Bryobacteraceae bacterium]